MPAILFPSEPFDPKAIDADFAVERDAASAQGFETFLIDHTAVTEGAVQQAVSRVRFEGPALYRGWMLTTSQYATLYAALASRNVNLINTPEHYRFCHHLPESYPALETLTPESVWLHVDGIPDYHAVCETAARLDHGPAIIKDFVKSQKHYWAEACFVPDVSDRSNVERVARRFVELQGPDLNGGLVFRRYVPLKIVGMHPRSGMPLAAEFRTFWLDRQLILSHKYWADLTSFETPLPMKWMATIVPRVSSRFFTMDIAQKDDGTWIVVELGDGQVAGLPSSELAEPFFGELSSTLQMSAATHDSEGTAQQAVEPDKGP